MRKILNRTTWSLRQKILLSMVTLLLLLGLTTALINRMILPGLLKTEFQHKGTSSARSLAANSLVDVLTQNTSRLKKIVEDEKRLDPDIAYIFILDPSGHILTHTFSQGFPTDLGQANNIPPGRDSHIQTLDTQLGFIYDIAVPIFSEKSLLGQVRIGILQNRIQRTINTINIIFMGITLLVMAIGILLASKVSSLITQPISRLVQATQALQKGDFSTRINVKTQDEIGLLAAAFNEMMAHLNLMLEEVKRLTAVEERNRIALDLHDGDAQDLANIIKRIELCEKLFKIDPAQAYEELNALKESTKDILDRTRQVIYNLKSPEDDGFDLLDKLTAYIKDYEEKNDIKIKLGISAVTNHISPAKAKAIFYIVREAFTNIRKHSLAKKVNLTLESDGNHNLKINIKDYGKGFDVGDTKSFTQGLGSWGLINMRQRADSLGGTLTINSQPEQGTEISLDIPLTQKV